MTAGIVVQLGAPGAREAVGDRPTCDCGDARITVPTGLDYRSHAAGPLVVVGDLFDRMDGSPIRLSPGQVHAIVASNGRFAAERFWGRYLLFWRDRRTGELWAARDPSGAIPLFWKETSGGVRLFSDPTDAWPGGSERPRIDPAGLAHQLWYGLLPAEHTAIQGCSELLPGQARRFGHMPTTQTLWSPWTFAGNPRVPGEAKTAVRVAVTMATAALARGHDPIMLELSGGLDSSILAAALAQATIDWRAVTMWTPAGDGDERGFAQLVAQRWGVTLDPLAVTPDMLDLIAPPALARVRPGGLGMIGGIDRLLAGAAKGLAAGAIVSGTGGDNVFCSIRSAAPVLDAWRGRGVAQAWRTGRELAALTGSSIWTVLRAAARYAVRDRMRPRRWIETSALLAPGTRPKLVEHPWMDRATPGRAGTRAHIAALLRAHAVLGGLDRARTHRMLFPLLSQPVMEACLSIPSWAWFEQGRDRAVARAAFTDLLPPAIAARGAKGRLGSLLAPAYDRDRAQLRPLLLEGELAELGLIDRPAVERALASPAIADDRNYTRILELVDAELWCRSDPIFTGEGAQSVPP